MTATYQQTMKALTNLKDNLELLDLIKDTKEKVMDAIEFGWMGKQDLIEFAFDPEKVEKLDKEQMHDLIRELSLRYDTLLTELDTAAGGYC